MNKLDELIQQLCPNGVPYKRLGDVATISRGGNFQKKDFTESGVPCIHYGQIYTRYGLFVNETITYIGEETAQKQKFAEPNDVVMAVTSENIEDVCKCVAWLGDGKVAVSGHAAIIHHSMNPKYLVYWLHSSSFYQQKAKIANGTKVIEVAPAKLSDVVLPVPPLEVQHEIVRILDTFTELTSELTENLSKEFTARKHQYTYYRNKLLEKNTKAMKMKLGDIFDFQNGFAFKSRLFKESGNAILRIVNIKANQISTDNLVFFDEADYKENLSPYIVRQNDIVIAMSGATTGKIGVNVTPFNFYLNQRVGKFIPKENIVLSRYLYHLLLQMSEEIYAISEGGAQPNLSSEKLKKLTAYIPPISEQKRIVKVLDTFAYLCTDLTSGLPAEIEARQKQYEYYRDNLLSFTPAD